jgi:hypothetical protein
MPWGKRQNIPAIKLYYDCLSDQRMLTHTLKMKCKALKATDATFSIYNEYHEALEKRRRQKYQCSVRGLDINELNAYINKKKEIAITSLYLYKEWLILANEICNIPEIRRHIAFEYMAFSAVIIHLLKGELHIKEDVDNEVLIITGKSWKGEDAKSFKIEINYDIK